MTKQPTQKNKAFNRNKTKLLFAFAMNEAWKKIADKRRKQLPEMLKAIEQGDYNKLYKIV